MARNELKVAREQAAAASASKPKVIERPKDLGNLQDAMGLMGDSKYHFICLDIAAFALTAGLTAETGWKNHSRKKLSLVYSMVSLFLSSRCGKT